MKVLLTGATGLLGSNLARKLPDENFEVRALVRDSSNLCTIKNTGAEIFRGNFLNTDDLRKALKGCQAVIHAAANAAQWPNGYEHYYQINVEVTRLLLQESLSTGIERFILVGSANAFGPGTKEVPGDETSPFTPAQFLSGYMRSKYEAQMLVMDFVKNYNLPAIVVNPTFMLGKYDIKPSSGQLPLMAWGKQVMPCPPGGKNFIHVNDVASGIIQSIRKGKPGNCYLMGNENLSYQEFFIKMKAVCGFPKHLIPIPKAWIMAAGQAGSLYERLSGKTSRLNHANAPLLCAGNYYTAGKAIHELQLPQTPIDQAIADTLEWFEAYGYLKK